MPRSTNPAIKRVSEHVSNGQGLDFTALRYHLVPMDDNTKIIATAKYGIGQLVRHRIFDFRGVVFDIDPEFDNTDEWYEAIPEDVHPRKDQPFYHLFAENDETEYVAYVSEQNLVPDEIGKPVRHPQAEEVFQWVEDAQRYHVRDGLTH